MTFPDIAAAAVKPKKPVAQIVEPAAHVAKPAEPQIDMAEVDAEFKRDLQRAADQARATQRLNEYQAAGLEDTESNANLIREFVENSAVHGWWSSEIVDVAIQRLGPGKGTNQLTWRKIEAPAPPPAAEPQEVLEPWQLPIDADERMMKASTTKALIDLNQRRRKLTNQQHIGLGARTNRVVSKF